jgi:hypothetical protein
MFRSRNRPKRQHDRPGFSPSATVLIIEVPASHTIRRSELYAIDQLHPHPAQGEIGSSHGIRYDEHKSAWAG